MDPEKLKVTELRTELGKRKLDTKGVKSVLVARLRKAIEEENSGQPNQEKASGKDSQDDNVQEDDEKSSKVPQTPKKSPRLSKNVAATPQRTSPAATRRRTSSRPSSYLGRRTSPKKSDQNDMSRETSPEVSDSVLQEESPLHEDAIQEETGAQDEEAPTQEEIPEQREKTPVREEKPVSLETDKGKDSLPSAGNENSVSMEDAKENKETDVANENQNTSVSQSSPVKSPAKSPVKCSNTGVPTLKRSEDDENSIDQKQGPTTVIKSPQKTQSVNESAATGTLSGLNDTCGNKDDIQKVEVDTQHEEKGAESIDDNAVKSEDVSKTTEIPDDNEEAVDANKADVPDTDEPNYTAEEEDESMDINENDKSKNEDQFEENKETLPVDEKEIDSSVDVKQGEQNVEMTEIKHEEDMDVDMREQPANEVVSDKKRKRSPSPAEEERHGSPLPIFTENEPEIDESALILSWYDSDLNLVIDKNGFFTATPMHNDGFLNMWAGARASYGFLCGKVYYEAKIVEHCSAENEDRPHVLRVGWSIPNTSMQLGEEKFSFGYSSTGKKLTGNQYEDYGTGFGKDDVIGCYFDATSENVVLSYTINGQDQGVAFSISKEELGDQPLFPHVLSKNCSFACNFGQEPPWAEQILEGYVSIGNVEPQYKIAGPRRPEKKDDCEVIMICGLPACGKTTWATKYAADHPQKMYNVLGLSSLIDKMKDSGLSYKEAHGDQWKILVDRCTDALNKLLEMAASRRRNYILDQTNVYPSTQRRKMKNFYGYQRKAVVIVPSEEEFKSRIAKHKPIDGKEITDSMLLEMKSSFRAPVVGESFDEVNWVELDQEEGGKLIEAYNKEGKDAGYGEQQISKRPRIDSKSDDNNDSRNDARNRDNRDNRDYRDRRNNYSDRNRNPIWRGGGGGNMGWRDRPQRGGGHVRHGSGYGPPLHPRRRRGAPIPLVHRPMNRRGGNMDRRGGNDRGRALVSRPGVRPRVHGNYQGQQQAVWGGNQQGNWQTGQSQEGWGQQQSNWGSQPWSNNWKSYGQGSYNQNSYNSQGYGNGNWNSWNQQYYNQYWGQQQQSGQTTTSGQASNKQ